MSKKSLIFFLSTRNVSKLIFSYTVEVPHACVKYVARPLIFSVSKFYAFPLLMIGAEILIARQL